MGRFGFTVSQEAAGVRLDVFLSLAMDGFSRSRIQKSIKERRAFINQKPAKAAWVVKAGDTAEIEIADPPDNPLPARDIALDIIYEDGFIAVINKPQGMCVHPGAGYETDTLANALAHRYGAGLSARNGAARPGIVHRIDKNTSGLLVIAKNDAAHAYLAGQFAERTVEKKYFCVACGQFRNDCGEISRPIGRSLINRKKMAVRPDGKSAVTHYKVLERFSRHTYLQISPRTGRTHQIRVHLAYLGRPVLGDALYGGQNLPGSRAAGAQALHAGFIAFLHPETKERVEFCAPPPPYFTRLLALLKTWS